MARTKCAGSRTSESTETDPEKLSKRMHEACDDDFVTSPPTKIIKKAHHVPLKPLKEKESVDMPRLLCRSSLNVLVDTIDNLNEIQRDQVREIGFGPILSLKVKDIPTRLAYWVLDNFQYESCEIEVEPQKRVHVEDMDVNRVFGFPIGKKPIQRKLKSESDELINTWKDVVKDCDKDVVNKEVLPSDIFVAITNKRVVGRWFKIHFMLLLTTSLIECDSTGYIRPMIMNCLRDVNTIHEWNWGAYMIDRLVHHKKKWNKKSSSSLCGPILFLTAFYVDRVKRYDFIIPRNFPTISNWTSDALKQRQKIEMDSKIFGKGYLCDAIEAQFETVFMSKSPSNVAEISNNEEVQIFASKFSAKSIEVAKMMVELMKMAEEAPVNIVDDSGFKTMMLATQQLLALNSTSASPSSQNPLSQFGRIERNSDSWDTPATKEALEEMDKANAERMKFVSKVDDMPSFSLGLTQDFQDAENRLAIMVPPLQVIENVQKNEASPVLDDSLENEEHLDDIVRNIPDTALPPLQVIIHVQNNAATLDNSLENEDHLDSIIRNIPDSALPPPQVIETVPNNAALSVLDDSLENEDHLDSIISNISDSVFQPLQYASKCQNTDNSLLVEQAVQQSESENVQKALQPIQESENVKIAESHRMVKRSKDKLKKTENLLSPYRERVIDITEKLSKGDKELCLWILRTEKENLNDVIFQHKEFSLMREELMTIAPDTYISAAVIDVWCTITNKNEQFRAPHSPCRYFATTDVCYRTLFDYPNSWSLGRRMQKFGGNLSAELAKYPEFDLNKIDLIFFPIIKSEHFYIICVDIKNPSIEVIDNSPKTDEQYDGLPLMLRDFFVHFLEQKKLKKKASNLRGSFSYVEPISWADKKNKDCGIFAMRHMETYLGSSIFKTNIGIKENSAKQMRYLRVKYCAEILKSDFNELRAQNIQKASASYKKNSGELSAKDEDALLLGM